MLSQEGWNSRIVGIRDWTAWIGQGVHAGLAHKYGWKSEDAKAVVSAGYTAFKAE